MIIHSILDLSVTAILSFLQNNGNVVLFTFM